MPSGSDYLVTLKGDTLKGTLQMKGLSNLMVGTLYKVKLTDAAGRQTDLSGSEIRRIVKYINNTPMIFDAYNSPANGKYYFYQLHVDGKIKLYYDARSSDYFSQGVGNVSHSVGSYLVVKAGEQPALVSKSNFDEQAGKLFADSSPYQVYTTGHPEKAQYDYLPQLVQVYNRH